MGGGAPEISLGQKYLTTADPFDPNYNTPDKHRDLKKFTCPSTYTCHPLPILSISSIRMSGFSVLVFFKAWTALPGMAPTYVLLWPFSSATSLRPPTLNRKNCRSRARAIERAIEVLPTPGGPLRQTILPWKTYYMKVSFNIINWILKWSIENSWNSQLFLHKNYFAVLA